LQAQLSLYGGASSLGEAMRVCPSDAEAFFKSQAFSKHRSYLEAQDKVQGAIVDRLNNVIRAQNALIKRR
jgi:hypothetical protein